MQNILIIYGKFLYKHLVKILSSYTVNTLYELK